MSRKTVVARAGSVFGIALTGLIGVYQNKLTVTLWIVLIISGVTCLWAWGLLTRLRAAGAAFVHPALVFERKIPVQISPQRIVLAHNYMRLLDMKDQGLAAPDKEVDVHKQAIYDLRAGLINSGLFSSATQQDLGRDLPLLPVDRHKAVEAITDALMRTIRQKWQKYV